MTSHEQDKQGYKALTAALEKNINQEKRNTVTAVRPMDEMLYFNNKSMTW